MMAADMFDTIEDTRFWVLRDYQGCKRYLLTGTILKRRESQALEGGLGLKGRIGGRNHAETGVGFQQTTL